MGYYSQVEIRIKHGHEETTDILERTKLFEDHFMGRQIVTFRNSYIKWYSSFPEINDIETALNDLPPEDYVFIRQGEDYRDSETYGELEEVCFEQAFSGELAEHIDYELEKRYLNIKDNEKTIIFVIENLNKFDGINALPKDKIMHYEFFTYDDANYCITLVDEIDEDKLDKLLKDMPRAELCIEKDGNKNIEFKGKCKYQTYYPSMYFDELDIETDWR